MTHDERYALIDFLRRKQCGPRRHGEVDPEHVGCVEAAQFVGILDRDENA